MIERGYIFALILGIGLGIFITQTKIFKDTLMPKGRFEIHRVGTFSAFWVAVLYAFSPLLFPNFVVLEFVFIGFIGGGGWSLLRTKKKDENNGATE